MGSFTTEAKQASAQRVLALWQSARSDEAVADYLNQLGEIAKTVGRGDRSVTIEDLPAH
jgi:hypothetical protein